MISAEMLKLIVPVAVSVLALGGCGADGTEKNAAGDAGESETSAESVNSNIKTDTEMYVNFENGENDIFEISDGWTNGSMFNVTWRRSGCTFENDRMQLIIDSDKTPEGGIPYSGGEYRTKDFYGFGRYEVSMKPIKNDGVVSSFFTYTGPSDGNEWHEIDIEFLGKDTNKVQFNYFTDGVGEHEYLYDLGFDASREFHVYGFEWREDSITWLVDGEEVYTANESVPSVEGKIMMNAWCGTGVDGWLNAFDDTNVPLTAEYEWVRFSKFADS